MYPYALFVLGPQQSTTSHTTIQGRGEVFGPVASNMNVEHIHVEVHSPHGGKSEG